MHRPARQVTPSARPGTSRRSGAAERLARLADRVQVLSVTHAPQVAARAESHLLIAKEAVDGGQRVATRVRAIAEGDRREEIARMLAGSTITEEARRAAEKLIAGG